MTAVSEQNENSATMAELYPFTNRVYVKTSLLEVLKVDVGEEPKIAFSDLPLLDKLRNPKDGPKMAKKWAPLFVANALVDESFPGRDSLSEVLEEVEQCITQSSCTHFVGVLSEASARSIPPVTLIKNLNTNLQRQLKAETPRWTKVGEKIESLLSKWIIANREALKSYYEGLNPEECTVTVSLKKMARLKAKAS